ncbi:toast rack family protein [Halobacillus litoralis]|uniref:toast rack family protein n=1 Tax=Halobacillus litoralis TaxID=45668 RepID=UPI001CFE919D|nr:toast rack family protein [Halobacillus litoralis]WLR46589.1 toast rack family protein [Halobacillus litoralis]
MKKLFKTLVGASTLMTLAGCSFVHAGEQVEETQRVQQDEANQLQVDIDMGVGELTLGTGSEDWLEGSFLYPESYLIPELSYQNETIKLTQAKVKKKFINNQKSEWDVLLTNRIPVDLSIQTGAAESTLDLKAAKLQNLSLEAGVGELIVDLSGDYEESFDVKMETGVGESTVYLPQRTGVKITAEKGIGEITTDGLTKMGDSWVNEAYDSSETHIHIDAEIGVGDLTFIVK